MTIGGTVMILIGESFVHSDEDSANAYCERKTAVLQERAEELRAEEKTITGRQVTCLPICLFICLPAYYTLCLALCYFS